MRSILNVSLPISMVRDIKQIVKTQGFSSISEFIRHLIRLWNTKQLASELHHDRREFEAGKGKKLTSLSTLN